MWIRLWDEMLRDGLLAERTKFRLGDKLQGKEILAYWIRYIADAMNWKDGKLGTLRCFSYRMKRHI